MLSMPYDKVLARITEEKGLSTAEIEVKIKHKLDQLSGLISKDGAAHIVANELGVRLFPKTGGKCKIGEVMNGMRDVDVVGKVVAIYETRTFVREGGSGKVGNCLIGDETGTVRLVLWGNKADLLLQFKEGIIIKIGSAYARDNNGKIELHCNDRTNIFLNPAGEIVGEVKMPVGGVGGSREPAARKDIKSLTETDTNVELLGTIVQVFDIRFYEVCPDCNKRAKLIDGTYYCDTHLAVKSPDYNYVLNVTIDDGSGNIRCVFFRTQAEKLLGKSNSQMLTYKEIPTQFEDVKTDLLGNVVKIVGRVQKNTMFETLEFVAQLVFPNVNLEEETRPATVPPSGEELV